MTFAVRDRRSSAAVARARAAGVLRVSDLHRYDRTPDPRWVAELASLSPRSEHISWLHLTWEAGDPWEHVNRWVIWQMRPRHMIARHVLRELEGPHPRSTGHYCAPQWCPCHTHTYTWRGGTVGAINRRQWELFRETGCYATMYWIIQGTQGGHKRRHTTTEQKVLEAAGLPGTPSDPGALPFAEPDNRTWDALRLTDRMVMAGALVAAVGDKPERFDAEVQEGERAARRLILDYLGARTAEGMQDAGRAFRRVLSERRRALDDKRHVDHDFEEQCFIDGVDIELPGETGIAAHNTNLIVR